jgi:glycosyltransferase involved in cell wall biosynthesis
MNKKIYFVAYSNQYNFHTISQEMLKNPPEGYEYIVKEKKLLDIKNISQLKKNRIFWWTDLSFIKRLINLSKFFQGLYYFEKIPKDSDLMYCTDKLTMKKFPWVGDLDSVTSYSGHDIKQFNKDKKKIEKILSSKYCKKILPFSDICRRTIEKYLDTSKFKDKIEVVHFAADIPNITVRRPRDGKVRLIFVGSTNQNANKVFYGKGGAEILDAYKILEKKYPQIELTMVSFIPEEEKEKIKGLKNLKVIPFMPREELFKLYRMSNIFLFTNFLFPSMVFVEAMGSGLPIITTDMFGNEEMVEDKKTGLVIKLPNKIGYDKKLTVPIDEVEYYLMNIREKNKRAIVNGLVNSISKLIEDPKLRKKMSIHAREKYENEFSIKYKKEKLKRIFDEATKDNN